MLHRKPCSVSTVTFLGPPTTYRPLPPGTSLPVRGDRQSTRIRSCSCYLDDVFRLFRNEFGEFRIGCSTSDEYGAELAELVLRVWLLRVFMTWTASWTCIYTLCTFAYIDTWNRTFHSPLPVWPFADSSFWYAEPHIMRWPRLPEKQIERLVYLKREGDN